MHEIGFKELEDAITQPLHQPSEGSRLVLATEPQPFVAPGLHHARATKAGPFTAEVVFIEASAAVGKSTMARYLSHRRRVPLLDLSLVPVSTGSLKALVSDLSGAGDPVAAFHAGKLPIIIDALDEGRLLSNETGFESFLQTTGEFLLQDRSVTTYPKLIFFGRPESIKDARTWLELAAPDATADWAEVGFFEEREARALIDAYAVSIAPADAAYRRHAEPVRMLVDAYFGAIEAALGLSAGELWADERGRAFAGYAPVLAALGSLLAKMDNFIEVANLLISQGRQEAWSVIETVLDEILKRERKKLCDKLAQQASVPIPEEAYDAHEQLTFLAHWVQKEPLGTSRRVRLPVAEQTRYYGMVEQSLGDHPFVRQGELSNAVLGSVVLAHAVIHDLLTGTGLHLLADPSRQPFLWRCLRSQIAVSQDPLIDGQYAGYVLNSFWNDPITRDYAVAVRSLQDGSANVCVPSGDGKRLLLRVALPVRFYGQVRDCDVEVSGTVKLEGRALGGARSAFYVYGRTSLIADTIEVDADMLIVDGQLWLESAAVIPSPGLSLHPKRDSQVGWGGKVAQSYPWSGVPSTLQPPYGAVPHDLLTTMITECSLRFPPTRVLVVTDDYSFSASENKWVARRFANELPKLLKLLVKHGLATAERFGTYAQTKLRIHMKTTWADLRDALGSRRADDPSYKAFLDEAIRIFKR